MTGLEILASKSRLIQQMEYGLCSTPEFKGFNDDDEDVDDNDDNDDDNDDDEI